MRMKIVTSDQMHLIEERSERAGVSTHTLMENAGLAVAKRVLEDAGGATGLKVAVLVGPGNNGGDGLVAARHLHSWGAHVRVFLCRERPEDDGNLSIVQEQGVPIFEAWTDRGLDALKVALGSTESVVDAILGTGRSRPIESAIERVLGELAQARDRPGGPRLLALDVPTGLDADTGAVDPSCPSVDVTIALGYPKTGLYRSPGAARAGRVEVVDIGLPGGLDSDVTLDLMTPDWARMTLPQRAPDAHKGTFGRTLIVAGSKQYVGAAYLAATAAGRVGAGLVTLAIPQSLQLAVASKAVEPTYLPLPESSYGVPSPEAAHLIFESLPEYEALLVGPGIGQEPETRGLLETLLCSGAELPPTVVDADGLNFLASLAPDDASGWWGKFPAQAVLTPHPGEMARLTSTTTRDVQIDRVQTAVDAATAWNKVVVLKGAYTVVASPSERAMVSPFANPGLATAGTGDVLAGAIAGLLSQGLSLEDAAALGVFLHGLAGEKVADELGDTGMLAGDLLPALPRAIRRTKR